MSQIPSHRSRRHASLRAIAAASVLVAASPAARAHQGDHTMSLGSGLAHLLSEPDHVALLLLALAACAIGWRALRASRRRRAEASRPARDR